MENTISVLDILKDTTVDGSGFRTSIYAAGCQHCCAGCHNPQSWEISNGSLLTIDAIMEQIQASEFANVSFSGGDPLLQVEAFTKLAKRICEETNKTIWCYTGYLYEEIIASPQLSQILPYIDILVDGPYIETLCDESLLFRGSSNQRIINIPESLNSRQIVLWNNEFNSSNLVL